MGLEERIDFQKVVTAAQELNTNRDAQPEQVKLLCDFVLQNAAFVSKGKYNAEELKQLAERGLIRTVAALPAPMPPQSKLDILMALDDFEAQRSMAWAQLRASLKR